MMSGMIQADSRDVPSSCTACDAVTPHRRGTDGVLRCVPCTMSVTRPVAQVREEVGGADLPAGVEGIGLMSAGDDGGAGNAVCPPVVAARRCGDV